MNTNTARTLITFSLLLLCLLNSNLGLANNNNHDLDFAIGQKLMLDLRHYCPEPVKTINDQKSEKATKPCYQALTKLPNELKQMISETGLGGIILFADNLVTPTQIKQLTQDIQQAGLNNKYQTPLFISLDQEGGRVARLPLQYSTAFSGNMAIGATYPKHSTKFATSTGHAIANELKVFGFNVNHAPNVDVNINPNNPVINVRSFSQSPEQVAVLGHAQLVAMQKQGIIGTLKHFPGHGDTNVDSHTGLPRVEHKLKTITDVDLKPFQYAIDRQAAKMIMTAHIQFPALDDSTLINKAGQQMIKPATMSKAILTDLLRDKMGFDGVVITDALDMKGISDFFTETQAVIQTFNAGADIALMPIKIKRPSDITKLKQLITQVKQAVQRGELSATEIMQSNQRIQALKQSFEFTERNYQGINFAEHKALEQELAQASITAIKGTGKITSKRVHFIMPDPNKCEAISQAMMAQATTASTENVYTCSNYLTDSYQDSQMLAAKAGTMVIAMIEPKQSLAEIGGMDDLAWSVKLNKKAKWPKTERIAQIKAMMAVAKLQQQQVIFVALRAPYQAQHFLDLADDVIATYSYTHTTHSNTEFYGPAYSALAQLFVGKLKAQGQLPVTIGHK